MHENLRSETSKEAAWQDQARLVPQTHSIQSSIIVHNARLF